jgi:hypothetical protein
MSSFVHLYKDGSLTAQVFISSENSMTVSGERERYGRKLL